MARVLIVYSTSEGQTAKIAHEISGWLAAKGHASHAYRAQDLPDSVEVEGFDVVIAGSPVHLGAHDPALAQWARSHCGALAAVHSAFFSVSLAAAGTKQEAQRELRRIAASYLGEIGWKPDLVAYFAGSLAYSRYGLIKRLIMRRIARQEGGGVDSAHDYEYTDWSAVRHFADQAVETAS